MNLEARIVLVGITPGFTQALNALRSAQASLRAGSGTLEALREAKTFASFSGPMRTNLISLLDAIGLPRMLGILSAAELFDSKQHLVNFTSALRYPVTVRGVNYGGTPAILRNTFTREELHWLQDEVRLLPNATFIPLGPSATDAIGFLVDHGQLSHDQVLAGLPHPSGANAERIAYFLRKKAREALSSRVDADKLDARRAKLIEQVARLA